MVESIVQSITGSLEGSMPKELIVFIISMIPILELRGSILAAGFLKMEFLSTYIIAVIGNMLPIPFILFFIDKIFMWMKKVSFLKPMVAKYCCIACDISISACFDFAKIMTLKVICSSLPPFSTAL